jgi:hypothetical protein
VTAVVGTVAVAGVGAEGMRSALGSAAGVGMADSMAWRPGAAFVSAPSALPSLGNDKWAAYVQQGSDSGNNDVAAIGEDERDPNTMLHQWDQVVKWGSGLNPNDNQGNHPGCTIPWTRPSRSSPTSTGSPRISPGIKLSSSGTS